ncbi:MAG: hypothetical protein COY81_04115 [Candidatus Pacebacteria bacterium CG_4_10_14_0_8_um_filter_43_12]|nr:MAG: hypothetical protein COU66_02675 [Candidatus Pacebacteria bacterium CG10_big_fil_rev_8_21_14_0_10_44_11]PIY79167.1 MAG: hypothetical protein COY81_04115 [Candidatus Pacebacteria bacterium CG_4_10_14_0_8_um_filter_43_12]
MRTKIALVFLFLQIAAFSFFIFSPTTCYSTSNLLCIVLGWIVVPAELMMWLTTELLTITGTSNLFAIPFPYIFGYLPIFFYFFLVSLMIYGVGYGIQKLKKSNKLLRNKKNTI